MNNRYWQIALTYAYRPRFWIFGGGYLLVALWWVLGAELAIGALISVNFACLLACFVALHVRRQFGTPAAKVVPGFAFPHLVALLAISVAIWIVVPLGQAWLGKGNPLGSVAVHAIAGLSLALVICWRAALLPCVALPLALIVVAASRVVTPAESRAFIAGELPSVAIAVIVIAVVAYIPAIMTLLRLSDANSSVDDDLISELPRTDNLGRISEWFIRNRDAAIEHRLAHSHRLGWSVARWRLPVAITWLQGFAAIGAAALLTLSMLAIRSGFFILAITVITFTFLMLPYGPWQWRRHALGRELMLPVTRERFFRQIALALAWDVATWSGLATLIVAGVCCVALAVTYQGRFVELTIRNELLTVLNFVVSLWAFACLLFGIGLLTMRMRYWIPTMIGASVAWLVGMLTFYSVVVSAHAGVTVFDLYRFLVCSFVLGLWLARAAYSNWRREDVP